jgi:hypothetical protein
MTLKSWIIYNTVSIQGFTMCELYRYSISLSLYFKGQVTQMKYQCVKHNLLCNETVSESVDLKRSKQNEGLLIHFVRYYCDLSIYWNTAIYLWTSNKHSKNEFINKWEGREQFLLLVKNPSFNLRHKYFF